MLPSPLERPASSISFPRSTTSASASSHVRASAAASAESSPRECPAKATASSGSSSSRNAARLERKIAGCAKRVDSVARSKQSRRSARPRAPKAPAGRERRAPALVPPTPPARGTAPPSRDRHARRHHRACRANVSVSAADHPRAGGPDPHLGGSREARCRRSAPRRAPVEPHRHGCAHRACDRACSCARESCGVRDAARRRSRGWSLHGR